jgi:hypothetical protein
MRLLSLWSNIMSVAEKLFVTGAPFFKVLTMMISVRFAVPIEVAKHLKNVLST